MSLDNSVAFRGYDQWKTTDRSADEGDDTVCAFCGDGLPENPEESKWTFDGFCDAMCGFRYAFERATFPDDELHKTTRNEMLRAFHELTSICRICWTKEKLNEENVCAQCERELIPSDE